MLNYRSVKDTIDRIDQLSEVLASTEQMTIYHGFKGGTRMPFEKVVELLDGIEKTGFEIKEMLTEYQSQKIGGDPENLLNLCEMYVNRLLENSENMREITEKFKESSDGGNRYGFFQLWKDTKEWDRNTKKLINVRSNVELFMRNTTPW